MKFLIKVGKGLLIFIFVVFVFMPFVNLWAEYPLLAGAFIIILYCILQWVEEHIPYFRKRRDKKR